MEDIVIETERCILTNIIQDDYDDIRNLYLDEKLVSEQANFEKLADMLEIFFNQGGVHFQLTYASKDDLVSAKASPENYKSLRVRVTGFSDYFVKLKPSIQDDIISRTVHRS